MPDLLLTVRYMSSIACLCVPVSAPVAGLPRSVRYMSSLPCIPVGTWPRSPPCRALHVFVCSLFLRYMSSFGCFLRAASAPATRLPSALAFHDPDLRSFHRRRAVRSHKASAAPGPQRARAGVTLLPSCDITALRRPTPGKAPHPHVIRPGSTADVLTAAPHAWAGARIARLWH